MSWPLRFSLIFGTIFFTLMNASAAFNFVPQTSMSQREIDVLQTINKQIDQILPESIKNQLLQDEVEFKVFTIENTSKNGVPPVLIRKNVKSNELKEELTLNVFYINLLSKFANLGEEISVNDIFKSNKENLLYRRSLLKYVLGQIIHHIAFIYEDSLEIEKRFSHSVAFLNNAGFPERGFFWEQNTRVKSNQLQDLSKEFSELNNPRDAFAANLEYFLLDKDYKCRKSSLYSLFVEKFSKRPFEDDSCVSTRKILLTLNPYSKFYSSLLKEIDFSKLYSIHYLLAGSGGGLESRFGHSMLRLVFCSPQRTIIDQNCMEDTDFHYVVSFRGVVTNEKNRLLDGITGKYPMVAAMLPLRSVIDEYTKSELRSIKSLPLKLNKDELNSLLRTILEVHWSYESIYKFFTNNCSDEVLQLLKKGLPYNKLIESIRASRPDTLYKKLINSGLGLDEYLENQSLAVERGYLFLPHNSYLQRSIETLKRYQVIPESISLEKYLETKVNLRSSWAYHEKVRSLTVKQQIEVVSSLIQLEELIIKRNDSNRFSQGLREFKNHMTSKDAESLEDSSTSEGSNAYRISQFTEILMNLSLSPFHLLRASNSETMETYGLPLEREVNHLEEYLVKNKEVQEIIKRKPIDDSRVGILSEVDEILSKYVDSSLIEEINRSTLLYQYLKHEFNYLRLQRNKTLMRE